VASEGIVGLSVNLLIRAKIVAACAASDSDVGEIAELKRCVLVRLDAHFSVNRFVGLLAAALLDAASKNKKIQKNLNMPIEQNVISFLMLYRKHRLGQLYQAIVAEPD